MTNDAYRSACWWNVFKYFQDDPDNKPEEWLSKTTTWFSTSNPQLGGLTPNQMVDMKRADKLLTIIKAMLSENGTRNED